MTNQTRRVGRPSVTSREKILAEAIALLQQQGLSALRMLAVNEQIALDIASADGIQVVVGAMRTHPANVKVQQRACRALLQIGLSDAGVQRRMKEAGVVALVEAAVRAPNATSKCRDKGQELLRLFT